MRICPGLPRCSIVSKHRICQTKPSSSRMVRRWQSLLEPLRVSWLRISSISSFRALIQIVYSGAKGFDLLSREEQEFALTTTVQYAPRAYQFIRYCKATDDGFSIAEVGREMPKTDLDPFDWNEVHAFPVRTAWVLRSRRYHIADRISDGMEK